MKNLRSYLGCIAMLALGLCFTACSDDDGPEYSKTVLQNTELKTILEAKGYSFNEQGNLLLDDKANQTTSLDLSNTNISQDALSELSILPNLTDVNLSNNGYKMSFDFSKLPDQITGVDLTGNEIYEYPGLLNIVTQENGDEDVTVLHNLTKLYLPESAKYNCVEIPTYFAKVEGVDMKMANASGALETYTTLREVPDDALRAYLQETFPSIFNNDKIDLSKRFVKAAEATGGCVVNTLIGNNSIEGAQYVVMNPSYKGAQINLCSQESCDLPYLKLKSYVYNVVMDKVNTGYLNMDDATSICSFYCYNNNTIENIDLSMSTLMGQRGTEQEFATSNTPSAIIVHDCPVLSEIAYPENAKYISNITLYNLPMLKNLDFSNLSSIVTLKLGNLAGLNSLTYFVPDGFYGFGSQKMMFGIGVDIYEFESTKKFLDEYHDHLIQSTFSSKTGVTTYRWSNDYK